jgi:hypothetical protein
MSECGVVVVEVSEVLTRAEQVADAFADMMSNPHSVTVIAAELDEQAAVMELRAAQCRVNAVRCEDRGDAQGMEVWSVRAEDHATHAAQLRRHRAQFVSRYSCRRQPFDGGC